MAHNIQTPSKEAVNAAKNQPNGWIYQINGNFGPDEKVPVESIVGAWKVDHLGNIVGDFVTNPYFKRVKLPSQTSEDQN